jgi:integrase
VHEQIQEGKVPAKARRVTVGEWLQEWLSGLFVEPRTLRGYREAVANHLTPAFGHIQLRDLTTQQIRAFCQQRMAPRGEGGGGLHQTTVHNLAMVLRIALSAALDLGLITKNPAAVRKTIPPAASREMLTWEPDECQRFLAVLRGDPYEVLFHFALATGCRQGEIQALRWSAVDLARGTASIKASISAGRRKGTKTDSGERLLHLPPYLIDMLTERKARRRVVRLDQDDPVFANLAGNEFSGCNLRVRHMEPLMRRAHVRRIRFHDLRHTFATLMLRNGVPVKDVAYMLGHSDAATTIRVYAHAIPSTHGAHAALMGALLTRPPANGSAPPESARG